VEIISIGGRSEFVVPSERHQFLGRIFEELNSKLINWIEQQPVFFVATAPVGPDGHINVSPKGARDTLRVITPRQVAYLDLIGSGAETIAHLRENGRIVLMFCAFTGPPKVLRLHGRGRVIESSDPTFDAWSAGFNPTADLQEIQRSVIVVDVERIADSCGFVVPRMELVEERDLLQKWGQQQGNRFGSTWKEEYVAVNNQLSIDGLPALDIEPSVIDLNAVDLARRSSAGKAL